MRSSTELDDVATELLGHKDLQLLSCESIQSLWAGYGHICRVGVLRTLHDHSESNTLDAGPYSLILKYVKPPISKRIRGSQAPDEGHLRKVLSYQIEQYFYAHLAPQMPTSIGVAAHISSINSSKAGTHVTAMMMTDLKKAHPVAGEEVAELSYNQTHAALQWLADFHGFWWTKTDELRRCNLIAPPLTHFANNRSTFLDEQGIWLNGGYTYLATRMGEYANLQSNPDSEWSSVLCNPVAAGRPSVARLTAAFLSTLPEAMKDNDSGKRSLSTTSSQPYQTLLHGDVKSENLFSTESGDAVAFYDFQYVGLGLGVCDLAKFFTCCVPLHLLLDNTDDVYKETALPMQQGEENLLREYLTRFHEMSGKEYDWDMFVKHWETALVDWLRFQASWGFWGNSEWLEARVRAILSDKAWLDWLQDVNLVS